MYATITSITQFRLNNSLYYDVVAVIENVI